MEVNEPRLNSLRTRILSQIYTWFIQEACLGVRYKGPLGCPLRARAMEQGEQVWGRSRFPTRFTTTCRAVSQHPQEDRRHSRNICRLCWRMKVRVESAPSQGDHKGRPYYATASHARACIVAKERFFPFTRKFHSMCHSPAESL